MSRRYKLVRKPGSRQTFAEHRLVVEKALGRPLRRDEFVHHKNHDRFDNRRENLEVLTAEQHSRIHNDKHPRIKTCEVCGRPYEPEETKRARAKTCGTRECVNVLRERNRQATIAKRSTP